MKPLLADVVMENRRALNDMKHIQPPTPKSEGIEFAILVVGSLLVIAVEFYAIYMGNIGP